MGKSSSKESTSSSLSSDYSGFSKPAFHEKYSYRVLICMMVRNELRESCGWDTFNRQGHFIDTGLSMMIGDYVRNLWYPKHDHQMDIPAMKHANCAALSSDGISLWIGTRQRSMICWNLITQDITHEWDAQCDLVSCLSCQNGYLANGGNDNIIRVWQKKEKKKKEISSMIKEEERKSGDDDYGLILCFKGHFDLPTTLSFNRDASSLASGSDDKTVRVWSLKSGQCLKVFKGHTGFVKSVLYFEDDITKTEIISASEDRSIKIWNPSAKATSSELTRNINGALSTRPFHMSFNSDASRVAFICELEIVVCLWPEMTVVSNMELDCYQGCFHPSHPHIFAIDGTNRVYLIDVRDWKFVHELVQSGMGDLRFLEFTPDGSRLLSVSKNTIYIWDLSNIDLIL